MKTLLFLGLFASAVYANGSETWSGCWSHVLDRASIRELDVRFDERAQRSLAHIDQDQTLAPRFSAAKSSLQGELEATIDAELARIHTQNALHLKDLRRVERETPGGHKEILWYQGEELVVQRIVFKKQPDQAKPGELLFTNARNDNEWSARPTFGSILIYNPLGRPVVEIQTARHIGVERPQANISASYFVESDVPYVSAIYRFEYTEKQKVVVDRPSRAEQRARTIARNREREFRNLRNNPVEVDLYEGDEWVGYYVEEGQSLLNNSTRRFRPTRPQVEVVAEMPYVWEKLLFHPPTLYDTENRAPKLMDRLAAHGSYVHGGGVNYTEKNALGGLHVTVECNYANYCVETWYEKGRVIRTVNGRGNRIIRQDLVNRQRIETRPNRDFPWDPNRIPGMALHFVPRVTPVNLSSTVVVDPVAFTYYQPVLGVSAMVLVANRRP